MKIHVTFDDNHNQQKVKFQSNEIRFPTSVKDVVVVKDAGDPYEGDYAVTPKVNSQKMLTKGKMMVDDVTIHPIPFFDVSNTSGGTTVYIAKEI